MNRLFGAPKQQPPTKPQQQAQMPESKAQLPPEKNYDLSETSKRVYFRFFFLF